MVPNPRPLAVKTALNRVANMPFRWSLNPYRGCAYSCVYCYARVTHKYLGLDPGRGFETDVLAKVDVGDALARELGRPRWRGEEVAVGTATDPYQPAEARLRLTRRVLELFLRFGNPVSITTKSPIVLRDLDILRELARGPGVVVHMSVGTLDPAWRWLEPGTAHPRYRLQAVAQLVQAGVRAGVLMAPIVPHVSDRPDQLEDVVRAAAEAGAAFVSPIVLRLPHGAREWFLRAVREHRPELAPVLAAFYRTEYAPRAYVRRMKLQVEALTSRYRIRRLEEAVGTAERHTAHPRASEWTPAVAVQLGLPM